ncbi:hemin ABC transporter substrate-binding protein [Algoriphagus aquatilis]|uniref:Hemin ABC transporter substrate-binding protein n=2 Tax=Algoriphagus aquatilis TaxID=490186 RepID=A0ABW0BYG6_9BACT
MIRAIGFMFILLLVACKAPQTQESSAKETRKIITAGGTVTEIVNALGYGGQIIATDITSTYPASMQELPSIGYRNQIKAEGILALGPDLILAEEGYLTDDVVNQLKSAQIEIHFFKKPIQVEETKKLITDLAAFFEAQVEGNRIVDELQADLDSLRSYLVLNNSSPKAAFIMARGPQTVFMSGEGTFAQSIFELAGLQPAATGFKDFVPVTPEALVTMNPEFLIFFDSGIESLGGMEGLAQVKGLSETPAFKNSHILSFDGHYLSGFGPRVGKAALELAKAARP